MEAVKTEEQAAGMEYWSRRNCIGSSDIKSIVGTCSVRGPHNVHAAKTDENYKDKVTPNMEVGLVMEPALGELTRIKLAYHDIHVVLKPGKTYHKEVEGVRLRDTPDFIAVETNRHRKPLYVVETKTGYSADRDLYGDEWSADVHPGYKDQCIWHCGMTGAPYCVLAVQFWAADFPKIYVIPADGERFDYLVRSGVEFWKRYVDGDEMPPVDETAACRKNLSRLEEKRHNLIECTDEQVELAQELKKLPAAIDILTKRKQEIENGFIKDIGEYKGIDFLDGAKFTFTTAKNGNRRMHANFKNLGE
tara:strand:- start:8821 stop:9735 length:915 start_codon:yes stop_codon:yes gene_type:complete